MGRVARQLEAEDLRRWRQWILPPLVAMVAVRIIFGGVFAGIDSPLELAARFLFGALIGSVAYVAFSFRANRPTTTDAEGEESVSSSDAFGDKVFNRGLALSGDRWESLSAQIRECQRR